MKFLFQFFFSCLFLINFCEATPRNQPIYNPYATIEDEGEIAYRDRNNETDLERRSSVTGYSNWDYHQKWRYEPDAYFSGETQMQYYRQNHPRGSRGIGYDTDSEDYHNFYYDDRLGRYGRSDPRWNDRGYPNSLDAPQTESSNRANRNDSRYDRQVNRR